MTVASSNIAEAAATACAGCHSTAVAVQVVFVTGTPQYYVPANVAAATNAGCNGCGTYAYAWQYLVQTSGPVRLSPTGQQRVDDLRRQIADAAASIVPSDVLTDACFTLDGPPYPCETRDEQLDAKLNALTAELKSVIDSQLQLAGITASGTVEREDSLGS
jgi:hypothetical protein